MTADFLKPPKEDLIGSRTYEQGDILSFETELFERADVTIVKSGSIEIFERSRCAEFSAYRPVTIFRPGGMFGLFDFTDRFWGWTPLPRKKEAWEIAAGAGATLLLASASASLIEEMYCDVVSDERLEKKTSMYEPRDLLEVLLPPQKIELDFYKFRDAEAAKRDYPTLFDAILQSCLASAREYRHRANLYNQGFYDSVAKTVLDNLFKSRSGRMSGSLWGQMGAVPEKEFLVPVIIHATLEALERPALNSPMFFKSAEPMRRRKPVAGHEAYESLTLQTVLRAFHPSDALGDDRLSEEMYYPLGFQNLSVNRFMASWWNFGVNTEAAGNLKGFFNPTTRSSQIEAASKSNKGAGTNRMPTATAKAPFGFKDLIEQVIKAFKDECKKRDFPPYPFDVEVRIEPTGEFKRYVPLLVVRRSKA